MPNLNVYTFITLYGIHKRLDMIIINDTAAEANNFDSRKQFLA